MIKDRKPIEPAEPNLIPGNRVGFEDDRADKFFLFFVGIAFLYMITTIIKLGLR